MVTCVNFLIVMYAALFSCANASGALTGCDDFKGYSFQGSLFDGKAYGSYK